MEFLTESILLIFFWNSKLSVSRHLLNPHRREALIGSLVFLKSWLIAMISNEGGIICLEYTNLDSFHDMDTLGLRHCCWLVLGNTLQWRFVCMRLLRGALSITPWGRAKEARVGRGGSWNSHNKGPGPSREKLWYKNGPLEWSRIEERSLAFLRLSQSATGSRLCSGSWHGPGWVQGEALEGDILCKCCHLSILPAAGGANASVLKVRGIGVWAACHSIHYWL